jgi:hypothetical protein
MPKHNLEMIVAANVEGRKAGFQKEEVAEPVWGLQGRSGISLA